MGSCRILGGPWCASHGLRPSRLAPARVKAFMSGRAGHGDWESVRDVTSKGEKGKEKPIESGTIPFSVSSALWEELGERLVGKNSTALAELIKNSYDADARKVTVTLDPKNDLLVVEDDGHGMTLDEFTRYWMRIGESHKKDEEFSRHLKRPLTGSKGVGRIAARVLSQTLRIVTVSEDKPNQRLSAELDWRQARKVAELTEAEVEYELFQSPTPLTPGTRIEMRELRGEWKPDEVEDVARQIWQLQSPFPDTNPRAVSTAFRVEFESPDGELVSKFKEKLEAVLDLWDARIVGSYHDGALDASLQFSDESRPKKLHLEYEDAGLKDATFQIRVFQFQHKQRHGIKVQEAREYLDVFRGVHIFDSGFRLPYYGSREADWLGITQEQTRRLSISDLLPRNLVVQEGLYHLPHIEHLIGAVQVRSGGDTGLEITITRDRLKESPAYDQLVLIVRTVLHWYANEKAKRRFIEVREKLSAEKPSKVLRTVDAVVDEYADKMPKSASRTLRTAVKRAIETTREEERRTTEEVSLLTSLATAGIAAVAYHHEITKQLLVAERIVRRIDTMRSAESKPSKDLEAIRKDLSEWVDRTKKIGSVFGTFSNADNLKETQRFSAASVVQNAATQLGPVLAGVTITTSVARDAKLPEATYAEWFSLLQNVLFNAANAMQNSPRANIRIDVGKDGKTGHILVSDTGRGVELKAADRLFLPFERGQDISKQRMAAGYGGTGLGLTIVRLVADRRGCKAGFVKPMKGFATTFSLTWEE